MRLIVVPDDVYPRLLAALADCGIETRETTDEDLREVVP